MSADRLKQYLKQHPQTRYLDAFYSDLSGVIRGKRYPISMAEKIFDSGLMMPGSSYLLAVTGESMDPCGLGFSDGDPDEYAIAMADTLKPMPWAQLPTAQVQLSMQDEQGNPYYYEPRNVLKRVLDQFNNLGYTAVVAFELEFYLFDLKRDKSGHLRPPLAPLTGKRNCNNQVYSLAEIEDYAHLIDDITKACEIQQIETGAITAEYAPGQFEINLGHLDDPLKAADNAAAFKRIIKGVARKHNLQASFMSKPYLDNAGSGLHLHLSLIDKEQNNVFDGGGEFGSMNGLSPILQSAIAGLLEIHPESMAIFAANANAFKRYVPNIFVPTTPSWGMENRSVAVRIPKSSGKSRRIEHRVAGADANPYLLLSALLAGIHYGISEALELGPESQGNASENLSEQIPFDLPSALKKLEHSDILNHYIGHKYIQAYCECKRLEHQAFLDRNIKDDALWYL